MAKSKGSPAARSIDALRQHLRELEELAPSLSSHAARKARTAIEEIRRDLSIVSVRLDPIKEPEKVFDPSNPNAVGRLVALTLLAQPRVPLDLITRAYGAGVYAIYYRGNHPFYTPISKTETPIYVGKADPESSQAHTVREQGTRLYMRLRDHRKVIRQTERYGQENSLEHPLAITDFECRRLVTATNAQLVAERHLINFFRPVWNNEMKVCWGISKHGDKAGRLNDRSPWFVVHPTEYWASQTKLKDSRPKERIVEDIARHFAESRIFTDRGQIIEEFLSAFVQDPLLAAAPVEDDDDENGKEETED